MFLYHLFSYRNTLNDFTWIPLKYLNIWRNQKCENLSKQSLSLSLVMTLAFHLECEVHQLMIAVYTQHTSLTCMLYIHNIQVYTAYKYTQHTSIHNIQVYTTYKLMLFTNSYSVGRPVSGLWIFFRDQSARIWFPNVVQMHT